MTNYKNFERMLKSPDTLDIFADIKGVKELDDFYKVVTSKKATLSDLCEAWTATDFYKKELALTYEIQRTKQELRELKECKKTISHLSNCFIQSVFKSNSFFTWLYERKFREWGSAE